MEANIIYKISKGDQRALDTFMDHYSDHLYRIAHGVVGVRETAEEVVADVFLEVWQQRQKLLEIESLGGWLRTITYRKAVSRLRHDTIIDYSGAPLDELENYFPTPLATPDQEYISNEEVEKINRAIEELSPKCRHVFSLAKLEKLPYEEISSLLGISITTINYHIKTAITTLKKKLLHPPPG